MKFTATFIFLFIKYGHCYESGVFRMASFKECSMSPDAVEESLCDTICVTKTLNHVQIRSCVCQAQLQNRESETWMFCAYEEMKAAENLSSREAEKLTSQINATYPVKQDISNDKARYLLMFPYKVSGKLKKFLFPILSDGYLGNPKNEIEEKVFADVDNYRSVTGMAFMLSTRTLYMVSDRKVFYTSLDTHAKKRINFDVKGPTLLVEADDYNKLIVFDVDTASSGRCLFRASPGGINMTTLVCESDLKSFTLDPQARIVYFGIAQLVYKTTYETGAIPRMMETSASLFCLVHYKISNELIFTSKMNVFFLSILTQKLNDSALSFRSNPISLVVRGDLLFISLANGRLFTYSLKERKLLYPKLKTGEKDVKYLLCNIY